MGKVYIVGAGPGDPELLTLKAYKIIKDADVIIYDRLVNKEILNFAKKDCELIYAGKSREKKEMSQEEINSLLVKKAKEKDVVVRLKGGDPFIFGRVFEEMLALKKNNIPFEIIPGITSAIAAAEVALIPITERRYSSSILIVTGQEADKDEKRVDFSKINADTIIILMGVKNLEKIVNELKKFKDENTPVAIVENATLKNQRIITGTLKNIVEMARKENVKPPAVIIVGEVVKLREELV